jgi:tetratricopeptide (TPR) repeat protein
MSLWDSGDRTGAPMMKAAATELLVDPLGYVKVAPDYFDLLCDAVAWVGMKDALLGLYAVADRERHTLTDAQRETRSVLAGRSALRPNTYPDLRAILARPGSADTRANVADIQEAAWKHNDERSFRLLAWYQWKTGDTRSLRALLEKNRINRGPWYDFYAGLVAEKDGELTQGREALGAAAKLYIEPAAILNQARIRLRQGQVEAAANLVDESLSILDTRSLGLQEIPGTAYAASYADALALRSRLFAGQGRDAEAQALLKHIYRLDPKHPALYQATGIAVSPETGMEQTRDTVEK